MANRRRKSADYRHYKDYRLVFNYSYTASMNQKNQTSIEHVYAEGDIGESLSQFELNIRRRCHQIDEHTTPLAYFHEDFKTQLIYRLIAGPLTGDALLKELDTFIKQQSEHMGGHNAQYRPDYDAYRAAVIGVMEQSINAAKPKTRIDVATVTAISDPHSVSHPAPAAPQR